MRKYALPLGLCLCVALVWAFRPPSTTTWTDHALEGRRKETSVDVFFLRDSIYATESALIHALLSRRPTLLFAPQGILNKYDIALMKREYPQIHWVLLQDENILPKAMMIEFRNRFLNRPFELYVTELTYSFSIGNVEPHNGLDDFVRGADRVHIFEEGNASHLQVLPTVFAIVDERRREEATGTKVAREKTSLYLDGQLPRQELGWQAMWLLPRLDYFLGRLDLLKEQGALDFRFLNLKQGWALLSPKDKTNLLAFLKVDLEGTRQALNAGPKPNLLVLGSTSIVEAEWNVMKRWSDHIVDKYAADYDLFIKPHPRDNVFKNYLEARHPGKFHQVTGAIPFEVLLFQGVGFDRYAVAGLSSVLLYIPEREVLECLDFVGNEGDRQKYLELKLLTPEKIVPRTAYQ